MTIIYYVRLLQHLDIRKELHRECLGNNIAVEGRMINTNYSLLPSRLYIPIQNLLCLDSSQ
jgi:hypothetical protein